MSYFSYLSQIHENRRQLTDLLVQPITKDLFENPLFFFSSQYIFAATAVVGSLVGTAGRNINHGEREIIAGVENTNQQH